MSEVHIRNYLMISKKDMIDGKVSTTSMCGLQDPKMNTLTFGDPEQVVKRKMKHPCERCRNLWVNEEEAVGDQAKALHKFRKVVGSTHNFSRFGKKKR